MIYPSGYVGPYSQREYEEVLHYIKTRLRPGLLVANALAYPLAITGPTGRLSAFPAESLAWLRYVRPDDEEAFVEKLERSPNSIVVWCPSEFKDSNLSDFARLKETIDRLYEPETTFRGIEIWRRKGLGARRTLVDGDDDRGNTDHRGKVSASGPGPNAGHRIRLPRATSEP